MTLWAANEEAIFKLPEAMKQLMEHDDTLYSADDADLIMWLCAVGVDTQPAEGILNELDVNIVEQEPSEEPSRRWREKVITPSKKKTDGQVGPLQKKAWRKERQKIMSTPRTLGKEVKPSFMINEDKHYVYSVLTLNLPNGVSSVRTKTGGHTSIYEPLWG